MTNSAIGYMVLTERRYGKKDWEPDWDGVMHPDREMADRELRDAKVALGEDACILVEVRRVE